MSLVSYRDTNKAVSRDSSSNLNLLLSICSAVQSKRRPGFENYVKDPHQLDALEEEFQLYESMSNNEIPKICGMNH